MTASLPILFLDIDDVLCLNERYGGFDVVLAMNPKLPRADDVLRQVFNRDACDVLQRLHCDMDGRLLYVISSTWRQALSHEQLQTVFRIGGLGFIADALHPSWGTPVELHGGSREEEIGWWLDLHHCGEAFAILDDTFSGMTLHSAVKDPGHPFFGRVVLCQEGVGLQPQHLSTLKAALSWPAQVWSSR